MQRPASGAVCGLVAALALAPAAWAQDTASPDAIIKSLTPDSATATTRGIRPVQPMEAMPAVPGHAGGRPRVQAQPAPTPVPATSLRVEFASGSAALTPAAVRTLSNLGRALSSRTLAAYRFRIEGHTDTAGSPAMNKPLSELRAQTVVAFIVSHYHVDPARLQAVGMGEDGLLVQTPTQTAEPRNRRVEIVNLGS